MYILGKMITNSNKNDNIKLYQAYVSDSTYVMIRGREGMRTGIFMFIIDV